MCRPRIGLKAAEQEEENIIREVILPYLVGEEEAVTWGLRRSEVWVDNRLRRLNRAILPGRGRAIDMIEAAKSHLGKVTPEQPVRARSATEPGPQKH